MDAQKKAAEEEAARLKAATEKAAYIAETKEVLLTYAEEVDVVIPPPKLVIPPMFVPKPLDGSIPPPRQNLPIAVVAYEDPADMYIREEPTLRKMEIGKEGDLGINFSSDMVYPDEWSSKLQSDTDTIAMEANGTLVGKRNL